MTQRENPFPYPGYEWFRLIELCLDHNFVLTVGFRDESSYAFTVTKKSENFIYHGTNICEYTAHQAQGYMRGHIAVTNGGYVVAHQITSALEGKPKC